jgi:hypothetical protein
VHFWSDPPGAALTPLCNREVLKRGVSELLPDGSYYHLAPCKRVINITELPLAEACTMLSHWLKRVPVAADAVL